MRFLPRAIGDLFLRISKQWGFFCEYLVFRWRYGFLARTEKVTGKTVLVVSLAFGTTVVLMHALAAKALQWRGARVVILTHRTYTWAHTFFRACGLTEFAYFDELMARMDPSSLPADFLTRAFDHPTFASLHALTWEGVHVGRHVLSTIVRRLAQGTLTFDDPAVTKLLETLLPEAMRTVLVARALYSRTKPDVVLFLEKGYLPYGVLVDIALEKNLDVVQYHHGHRSDAIILKRYNNANRFDHSFSVSKESWKKVLATPWPAQKEAAFMEELHDAYAQGTWFNRTALLKDKKLMTPDELRAMLKLDPSKKVAVIFSHILWDATFFFGTNLFPDYETWLIETVKAACENTSVQWIIKLHPDYVWKMKAMRDTRPPRDIVALQMSMPSLPDHVQILPPESTVSTYSFFGVMDYCITVRGTIGIESPCFGVPVITAGTGRYSGLGFTNDSATKEEYLEKIKTIQSIPRLTAAETTLARKHAYALFHLRPLVLKTFELVTVSGPPLVQKMEIRAHSEQEFRNARDVQALAQWILGSTDEDYLQEHS